MDYSRQEEDYFNQSLLREQSKHMRFVSPDFRYNEKNFRDLQDHARALYNENYRLKRENQGLKREQNARYYGGYTMVTQNIGNNLTTLSSEISQIDTNNESNDTNFSDYVVKSGDTLLKIAKNHNTSVEKILQLNPQIQNVNKIFINQKIRVK